MPVDFEQVSDESTANPLPEGWLDTIIEHLWERGQGLEKEVEEEKRKREEEERVRREEEEAKMVREDVVVDEGVSSIFKGTDYDDDIGSDEGML